MSTDWEPGAPDTIGLSYFPTVQAEQQLPIAWTFTSTATQDISVLAPFVEAVGDCRVLAEVFIAGDEIPGAVTTEIFRPNADLANQGNTWLNEALSTSNLYQSIDEVTADPSDFIFYFGPQSGRYYRFNVDTAAWPANQRVIGGFVRVRGKRIEANGQMYVSYFDGTNVYRLGTITLTQDVQNFDIPWPEYNPATGLPWTQAEIVDLDSSSAIQFKPKNINKRKPPRIDQAYLSLDWVTEDRVAVGTTTDIEPDSGIAAAITLFKPNDGSADWAKATATDYTILLRRIGGFGLPAARFLTETPEVSEALLRPDQDVGNPTQTYMPVLDTRGLVSVMGDPIPGRAAAFYMRLPSTAVSVDGQPYAFILAGAVYTGNDVEQELTPAAGATYDRMRVLVTVGDAATDLDMKIKRRSDNVQLGSTETLTVADAAALPALGLLDGNPVVLWEAVLTSPATLTTVQYYIEFSSSTTDPWHVLYLDGEASSASGTNFQGTGNCITVETADNTQADAPVTLSTEVDAPEDLAAETVAITQGDGSGCTVPTIDEIQLTWTATTLAGDFGEYQIERDDDGTFVQIRYGTEEDAEAVDDWESIRNEEATYRIRAVRSTDWVASGWSDTAAATASAYGSEVVFASNWLADAEAVNRTPEYEWSQPNNDRILQLSGRDYQIVFQESENRGDGGADGFEIEALVFTGSDETLQPVPDGRAAFSPLIDFLRAYTPYLAVLDFMGGRWYGRATVDETSIAMSQDRAGDYVATIRVVVTQDTPTTAPIPFTGS